jgi:lipopolysaccharide transport system permease protein
MALGSIAAVDQLVKQQSSRASIRERPSSVRRGLRDAWRDRALVRSLASRLIVRSVAGTRLGLAWLVVRPVLDTAGKALLFGGVLDAGSAGDVPYPLFLLVGLIAWSWFAITWLWTTRSFDAYQRIARGLSFSPLLLPIAASARAAIQVVVYIGVLVLVALVYLVLDGTTYLQLGPELLAAAVSFALAWMLAVALGLWTSVLNARARDVRLGLRYVIELWLFATPVLYPVSRLPGVMQDVAWLNPMTAIVELAKEGLLGAGEVEPLGLVWSIAFLAIATVGGLVFFERMVTASLMRPISQHAKDEEEEEEELPDARR